jgi:hypothetical protein
MYVVYLTLTQIETMLSITRMKALIKRSDKLREILFNNFRVTDYINIYYYV